MSIVAVHTPTMLPKVRDRSDMHPEAAALADLATLQADGTYGDGAYTADAFRPLDYITLADDSLAFWDGSAWFATGDVSADHTDAAALADLATLKADVTYGDGAYGEDPFLALSFITLVDDSEATWDGSVWTAYVAP